MRSFLMKPGVTDAELISQLNTAVTKEAERNSKQGIGQKGKAKVSKVERQAVSCKIGKDKPASQPSASLSEQVLSELKEIRAEVATLKQEVYYKKSAGAKASSKTPAYKKMCGGCKACHGMPHILPITVLSHKKTALGYCQGTTSSRPDS